MYDKTITRAQSIENSLISGFNSSRFALIEPVQLKIARLKHEREYRNPNQLPLVSVCVPTYNRGPLLIERAVASVLSQTYSNIELLIVGDHCTDNTEELLAEIKDPRLHFYNLPSRNRRYKQTVENHWFVGGSLPANKAMDLARGQWIARVDDDDTWSQDHIEKLLYFAQQGQYEFVSGLYEAERFGKRKVINGVKARDPYYTRRPLPTEDDSPKIGGVSTWLYRSYLRFMHYNINCWRKDWNKVWDVDLSLRIYKAGARMGFLDEVVSYILPRPGEATIGLDAYKLTESEKLKMYKFEE